MSITNNDLPKPGEVLHHDYRTTAATHSAAHSTASVQGTGSAVDTRPLKLLQWNIERGYKLELVIEQLRSVDADIISLQEVDVGCERSGCKDTGAVMAEALGLNYLFICEFEELRSPLRDVRSQGGGVHGNAILTKFDISSWEVVEHSHHPIDWNADPDDQEHPLAAKEPRRGRRYTLAADINTPQGPLRVYCCHLEVFCGITSRVWQLSDILAHAKEHQRQHRSQQQQQQQEAQQSARSAESASEQQAQQQQQQEQQAKQLQSQRQQNATDSANSNSCCQAILGDLNTMAHGIARLSPNYCCDFMRWRTLGMTEAEWWQKYVFAVIEPCPVNKYLLQLGLPRQVAAAAVNPGFFDPFDVSKDITLDNPAYRVGPLHLMAGKLDWTLLHGMTVVAKHIGNDSYAASDHKWLLVEAMLLHCQK